MLWNVSLYDQKHDFVAKYGANLLALLPSGVGLRILDFGCGSGTLTKKIADQGADVLGVDTSPEMIALARQKYPELQFQVADVLRLAPSPTFDVIFSNAVFHWISNHALLVRQLHDLLKPGGTLVAEFGAAGNVATIEQSFTKLWQQHGRSYRSKFTFDTAQHFERLLKSTGFTIHLLTTFDRPTPLKDGMNGLANWTRQFFADQLSELTEKEKSLFFHELEEMLRAHLWNGKEWVADYRRLRVVAQR